MLRSRGSATLLIVVALFLVACTESDRPDVATWEPEWQAMVEIIPDQQTIGDPPSEELCQQTLADIRAQREDLLPSPTESIDELANEWIAVAEEAFFDCPPEGQEVDSFDEAYEEMRRVEDSVASALADAG